MISIYLEAPRQCMILLEYPPILVISGRADAAQLSVCQCRLDEIGRVHDSARRRSGADDGMYFVDEQDGARLFLHLGQHRLQALLEITPILGAGDQRAHVEGINGGVEQHVGHLILDDHACQPLGDGGFADAGFAHVERVVLAPAAQDLDGPFHLELAADQRIDLAFAGRVIEVGGILFQRVSARRRPRARRPVMRRPPRARCAPRRRPSKDRAR